MEQIMEQMLDMSMRQFMDKSREELSMSDATYLKDNEDRRKLEQRYMELNLERNQRMLVNDYIACMQTAYSRYADICYVAGLNDAVRMMRRSGLLTGIKVFE